MLGESLSVILAAVFWMTWSHSVRSVMMLTWRVFPQSSFLDEGLCDISSGVEREPCEDFSEELKGEGAG